MVYRFVVHDSIMIAFVVMELLHCIEPVEHLVAGGFVPKSLPSTGDPASRTTTTPQNPHERHTRRA